MFRRWSEQLGDAVEVCAVELPGRGVRFGERPIDDMTRLCDCLSASIASLVDEIPLALFGHSMGARIAFELARRFDGSVSQLFVSASPAPNCAPDTASASRERGHHARSDAEFMQVLRSLGGTPPEVIDDPELMELMLPVLRADFALVGGYSAPPGAQIGAPVTAFAGSRDALRLSDVRAWRSRTSHAHFRMVVLDAGHFFLATHEELVLREIAQAVGVRARRPA